MLVVSPSTVSASRVRVADYLIRLNFVVLDELGHIPFVQANGELPSIWSAGSTERTSTVVIINLAFVNRRSRVQSLPGHHSRAEISTALQRAFWNRQ